MTVLDKYNRNIEDPTTWEKTKYFARITLIHLLIIGAIASGLWANMETKAREMERNLYKQQLDAKDQRIQELENQSLTK